VPGLPEIERICLETLPGDETVMTVGPMVSGTYFGLLSRHYTDIKRLICIEILIEGQMLDWDVARFRDLVAKPACRAIEARHLELAGRLNEDAAGE
jgi:hypothetical protein